MNLKLRKEKAVEPGTSIIQEVEDKKVSIKLGRLVLSVILVILSLIFIIPILWMFISAFKDTKEFLQIPPTLLPEKFDIMKFVRIWEEVKIGQTYLNSVIMMVGEIVFRLLICGLAGYVLSRLKPKGSGLVFAVVTASIMMPHNISMVPLFITFVNTNLLETFWPLWLMAAINCFDVILFKNFFDSIPDSYVEAAKIDGCSEFGIFAKIILPLSKPIMMTVSILTMSNGWGAFLWPYLVLGDNENLSTVGVKIYKLKAGMPIDEYLIALIFVILPPIIFFFMFQKYITKGVAVGGVKE